MNQQVVTLLEKYIDDRCTVDELEQIRYILQSGRYEEEWIKVFKDAAKPGISAESIATSLEARKVERLLRRIKRSAGISHNPAARRDRAYRWWIAVAASVLITLTVGISLFMSAPFYGESMSEISTQAEGRKEITLSDGTRVWLDDVSSLRYPDEFSAGAREVYLEGKAFFKVVHHPSKPFLVHTGELNVRVLGTSFGVRSYEDDKDIAVLVATGKVSVSDQENEQKVVNMLLPGNQLLYNSQTKEYRQQTVAPEDVRAWKEGKLIFQDQPLEDIIRAIERRYNVTFRFNDESVKSQRITFKQNSPALEDLLQVLSLVSGIDYELRDKTVFVKNRETTKTPKH